MPALPNWRARTWKDERDLVHNPLVQCGCGRHQSADMMVDVRPLPPELRSKLSHVQDFACDGCRQELILGGGVRASEVARHLGAPADLVSRLQVKERV